MDRAFGTEASRLSLLSLLFYRNSGVFKRAELRLSGTLSKTLKLAEFSALSQRDVDRRNRLVRPLNVSCHTEHPTLFTTVCA